MPGSRNTQGRRLGREDWAAAARWAEACAAFVPDVEEEQVADEPVSCYNCRYRRWTADAVTCMAPTP
jgi:hypothetical protein